MPFAIELFFDGATEAAIRGIWKELAEREIAPYLHESGNRPHVTLAIYEQLGFAECERKLTMFAEQVSPFALALVHLGLFRPAQPQPVVFCAPAVTRRLLAIHAQVHDLLQGTGIAPVAGYLPDQWVPHCTLAVRFPGSLLCSALECSQQLALPMECHIEEIGVAEVRRMQSPAKHLVFYRLGGGG